MQLTASVLVKDADGVITTIKKAVGFGVGFIAKETPIWATNLFRVSYFLTKVVTAWIAGTHLIPDADKVEIGLFLNVVWDSLMWLVSHMFGIKLDDLDQYQIGKGTQTQDAPPQQAQAIQ